MASLEIFTASPPREFVEVEVFLVLLQLFLEVVLLDLPFSKTVMFLSLRRA